MTLKKLKKEDLEIMSYNDIANLLLIEEKQQTTPSLFKKIVDLLDLSQKTYENKIGDFYTAMLNDKRFVLLEDGNWDLRKNHKSNIVIAEDLDDYDVEEEIYDDVEIYDEEPEEELFKEESDDDITDTTEEYKNLVIIDEEDLNNED